jgi:hypothetical protein
MRLVGIRTTAASECLMQSRTLHLYAADVFSPANDQSPLFRPVIRIIRHRPSCKDLRCDTIVFFDGRFYELRLVKIS